MPLSSADIKAIVDAVWFRAMPDVEDGSRGAQHLLAQIREDSHLARIDAAIARRLLEEGAGSAGGLSPETIERIAEEVRNEFAERPLR